MYITEMKYKMIPEVLNVKGCNKDKGYFYEAIKYRSYRIILQQDIQVLGS